jgi:hypothetical protein
MMSMDWNLMLFIPQRRQARIGKGSLVLKSVFIESSIDSSIDDMPSFNASIKSYWNFG